MTTTRAGYSVTLISTGSVSGPGRTPPNPEVRVQETSVPEFTVREFTSLFIGDSSSV